MTLRRFASAIGLVVAAPAVLAETMPEAPAGEAAEVLRTRTNQDHRLTVPVHIGGRGPFDFVIDTGSQSTVLAQELVGRLALQPGRKARIVGMSDIVEADTVRLEQIALGSRTFGSLIAPVFKDEHIGADGILGIDTLQQQRVLLDFARNSMAVGDARTLGGNKGYEIVVTARRRLGQLIMTNAVIDGVQTEVVIDTGSDTSVGNRALQRALARRSTGQKITLVSVTGASTVADLGFPRRLDIGDIGISNMIVAYADSPVFAVLDLEKRPAMMLGMRELRLFRRVAIDFASRKVYFDMPEKN
jgi:predicted aspartyl protease